MDKRDQAYLRPGTGGMFHGIPRHHGTMGHPRTSYSKVGQPSPFLSKWIPYKCTSQYFNNLQQYLCTTPQGYLYCTSSFVTSTYINVKYDNAHTKLSKKQTHKSLVKEKKLIYTEMCTYTAHRAANITRLSANCSINIMKKFYA